MNPIDQIQTELQRYPSARYSRAAFGIQIQATNPGGFPIALYDDSPPPGWMIYFGVKGANRYFVGGNRAADAVDFVLGALSSRYRLREAQRTFSLHCIIERLDGSRWTPVHESVVFPSIAIFKPRTEIIFQNTLIESDRN